MSATVLYVSYDGMTDNLGQSQVIPYIIGLSKAGYKFHILSCEKEQNFKERQLHISQLLSSQAIEWHPLPYTQHPPVISTLSDIRSLQKEAISIVKRHNVDFLHCRSYIAALIGMYVQKKTSLPWIFDMRGFWADERIDGKIWNISHPIYRSIYNFFKRKEAKFIHKSSHIISLTSAAQQEIASWQSYKIAKTPILVIPCCADLDYFNYTCIATNELREARNSLAIPADAFVISYLGSFGTWYMADEMFDFFARLRHKQPKAIFLCITPDAAAPLIEKARQRSIPESAIRVVKAQREEVAVIASIAQWSIFFIQPLYSKIASSPTKLAELLGLGIPIVCNSGVGDIHKIMQNPNLGIIIDEFTNAAYDASIEKMLHSTQPDKRILYEFAQSNFSLQAGVESYKSVYEQLVK